MPPAEECELDETAAILLEEITRLPERERQVVLLKYFEGTTIAAIAAIVGRPAGTIRKRLSRARERLRGRLGRLRP